MESKHYGDRATAVQDRGALAELYVKGSASQVRNSRERDGTGGLQVRFIMGIKRPVYSRSIWVSSACCRSLGLRCTGRAVYESQ